MSLNSKFIQNIINRYQIIDPKRAFFATYIHGNYSFLLLSKHSKQFMQKNIKH